MGRRFIIALGIAGLGSIAAGAAAQEPPAGGSSSDRQREGIGPVDKQREGMGPEGTDIGSPATKVKPMTAPAVRKTARYSTQEVLAGARRTSQLTAQLAQLAQQRARRPAVRRLAADIARDQQAAAGHMMGYARQHEVDLSGATADRASAPDLGDQSQVQARASTGTGQRPPATGGEAIGPFAQPVATLEDQLRDLKSARGTMFDTQFAQLAAQAHQQTLDCIRTASDSVTDPELRQVLETWRSSVQKDLDGAQSLASSDDEPAAHGRRPSRER
jgi:predicted outer membrane protein